jgi:hypothetical protein
LSKDDVRNDLTLPSVTMGPRDGIAPGGRIVRIASEEVGHARMVEHVVGRETTNPRESADIEGEPRARGGISGTSASVGGRQT